MEELLRRLGLNATGLADRLRSLFEAHLPNGKVIRATVPAGVTSQLIPHGLGRVANGFVVISMTLPASYASLTPPDDKHVHIVCSSLASPNEYTLWVF